MDEEIIFTPSRPATSEPQAETPETTDSGGVSSARIFDITPDLTISPVTEDNPQEVPTSNSAIDIDIPPAVVIPPIPLVAATPAVVAPPRMEIPHEEAPKQKIYSQIIQEELGKMGGDIPVEEMNKFVKAAPAPTIPVMDFTKKETPNTPVAPAPASNPVASSFVPPAAPNVSPVQNTQSTAAPTKDRWEFYPKVPPTPDSPGINIPQAPTQEKIVPPPVQSQPIPAPEAPVAPVPPAPSLPSEHAATVIKNIRTYQGDVSEAMSQSKTSVASIAIAENKRAAGLKTMPMSAPATPSHVFRNILVTLLCLILIGGGAYAAYYLYSQSLLSTAKPSGDVQPSQPKNVLGIIPADTQVVLPIGTLNFAGILSALRAEISKDQAPGTIKEIIPTQTTNSVVTRVSSVDMLSKLEVTPPDILTRSLSLGWMLGVYSDTSGQKSSFVIVTNDFFQNAFAGMLQWENVMADDLKQLIVPTDSLSTPITGQFKDRIIKNKDVREFQTTDGQTLFLYSFVDNSKLVVAGSEAALTEIVSRLEKQAYVR